MSDIFREVEEDVRRERYEQLWKEYGDYILAAAAFLVIAAAGWQLWRYYQQREQTRSSAEYMAAMQLAQSGQAPSAAQEFGTLASSAPSGYAKVARLQEAGTLQASGRTDDAVKLYQEIASGNDEILAAIARIRIAWATVESTQHADLQKQLSGLTDPASAWNPMAREILAYSDFRGGNLQRALAEYKSLAKDKNASTPLHERVAAMASFLTAGGGRDFGTLPRPAPAAPAAPATPTPQGAPSK